MTFLKPTGVVTIWRWQIQSPISSSIKTWGIHLGLWDSRPLSVWISANQIISVSNLATKYPKYIFLAMIRLFFPPTRFFFYSSLLFLIHFSSLLFVGESCSKPASQPASQTSSLPSFQHFAQYELRSIYRLLKRKAVALSENLVIIFSCTSNNSFRWFAFFAHA